MNRNRHVPIMLQIEAAECGAASLGMILAYYGRYIELGTLRHECKISRDGTTAKNLMEVARSHGCEAKAFRMGPTLPDLKLPAIVYWKFYHFMVVERMTDKWVYVCDPAVGRRRLTHEEFAADYSGVAIQIVPTNEFKKEGKPFKSSQFVLELLSPAKHAILFLSIIYILINIVGMIIPTMTSMFVDYYLPSLGYVSTGAYFLVFGVFLLFQIMLHAFRIRISSKFHRAESSSINAAVVRKLLKLPISYFGTRSHTGIISRLTSIDALSEFISAEFVPMILGIIFSLIYFVIMFYFSPLIAAITLLVITIIILIMKWLIDATKNKAMTSSNAQINFVISAFQSFRLFETIKSTAGEHAHMENNIRTYNAFENASQKVKETSALMVAIPIIAPLLLQAEVICIGSLLCIRGLMTVGTVLACQSIATSIYAPIAQFIADFSMVQNQEANIRGIRDIESEDVDIVSTGEGGYEVERLGGDIEFCDVSFSYSENADPIVADVSFKVPAGHSIAFVGASGSGKSTMLKLLSGVYIPLSGKVLFDGHEMLSINHRTVTDSMSVVSQTPYMFYGSVRDNITLFDRTISMDEVIEATKTACIYDDIEKHEGGFNAITDSHGSGFSGGQVQRIMIARALIRKPSILLLDEATSALDTIVEEQIMKNIKEKGITLVIVAHRLSTIRDCDEIIVIDNRHIAERGNHEQLMARSDEEGHVYRDLIQSLEDGE